MRNSARGWIRKTFAAIIVVMLAVSVPRSCRAYAVLAHQAIIDAAWDEHIKPLLLKRKPAATQEELSEAQAYAYGGAIIQDMGYYPYGSHFFSDLTHYVRSGDFVEALLRDATDLDDALVLITSDHGNLEDERTDRHTLNPVPAVLVGAEREALAPRLHALTDLAPVCLEILTAGGARP